VSGQLQESGGGGPERCAVCGGLAVGPCATCRRPVCGDCCELTQGGVKTWAVCLGCARRSGTSLAERWGRVLVWVLAPTLVVAGVAVLVAWLAS
jgi:hypothetical protein